MAVSVYPQEYSPVKQPVMFTINDTGIVEVAINGYYKQLPSSTRSVNVSPYFIGDFNLSPLDDAQSKLDSMTSLMVSATATAPNEYARKAINSSISINGTTSSVVPLLYAEYAPTSDVFLSDLKNRCIGEGEVDEVTVLRDYITTIQIVGKNTVPITISGSNTLFTYYLKPSVFADATGKVSINLLQNEQVLDTITYTITPYNGERLAWVNAYGGIDSYIFSSLSKSVNVEKDSIYLSSGYKDIDIMREEGITVVSRPLPEATLRALSYILASTDVWRYNEDSDCWDSINITSTSSDIYNDSSLDAISVTFKSKLR